MNRDNGEKKTVGEVISIVDQDEEQIKDESNKEWVEAWKKEVNIG